MLAPIAGEAVERLAAPGQVIQAGATQVFTISNMSSVWVLANVYQKDLPYVHLGDPVTITTDSYPGTEFHGKISYIAAALDPNTRTLQARIDVKNPQGKLKKDMYVVATVQAGTIHNALTVPNAAVLRDTENQPFVYVVNQNNEFARRAVTLGESRRRQYATHQRRRTRRACRGRRQLVPAICEFITTMTTENQTRDNERNGQGGMIHRIVQMSLRQRFLVLMLVLFMSIWGVIVFPANAGGCVSRPLSADGGDHHPMARPCRRGDGAVGHSAA